MQLGAFCLIPKPMLLPTSNSGKESALQEYLYGKSVSKQCICYAQDLLSDPFM